MYVGLTAQDQISLLQEGALSQDRTNSSRVESCDLHREVPIDLRARHHGRGCDGRLLLRDPKHCHH
jgi:hypothetical protein